MKKLIIFSAILFSIFYLLNSNTAQAATLNVPGNYSTIQSAVNAASAGDTVLVAPGTYNERVSISRSGNSGTKIVVKASSRREAKTQGFSISGNYIRVEGFTITSNDDGISISGDNVEVVDNFLNEVRRYGITNSGNSNTIADNKLYHPQSGMRISGTNTVVENNEIDELKNWGTIGDCDYSRFFGSGHIFRNNYFHGTNRDVGDVDCFQTFDINGQSVTNILIENNTCYNFDQGLMSEATKLASSHHITLRNNVFAHGGRGIISRDGMSYITVDHNTIVDMDDHGIWLYQRYPDQSPYGVRNGVVTNNLIYDAGSEILIGSNTEAEVDYNFANRISGGTQGSHNIISRDPRFTDYANNNFKPQVGSLACGNGEGGSDIGAIPCSGEPPSCSCTSWQNDQCGGGSCSSSQMRQTRTCTPSGCNTESRCVADSSCETIPTKTGDLNKDGLVNSVDFGIMMSYWGKTTKPPADINQDGIVNSVDFGIMISQWTS